MCLMLKDTASIAWLNLKRKIPVIEFDYFVSRLSKEVEYMKREVGSEMAEKKAHNRLERKMFDKRVIDDMMCHVEDDHTLTQLLISFWEVANVLSKWKQFLDRLVDHTNERGILQI